MHTHIHTHINAYTHKYIHNSTTNTNKGEATSSGYILYHIYLMFSHISSSAAAGGRDPLPTELEALWPRYSKRVVHIVNVICV